jgi:4-amino-4-deoxy-L-arabinose transferase-like glycosyltransferase
MMVFSKKEKIVVGIAYALFLILFYFIGIPGHKGFLDYALGFLAVTAFFALGVWFVKTKLLD